VLLVSLFFSGYGKINHINQSGIKMEKEKLIVETANGAQEVKSTSMSHKRRMQPKFVVFSCLIVVIAAAIAFAIVTGRLVVSIKDPGQRIFISSQVCSDSVVTSYNDAMKLYYFDEHDKALSKMVSIVADFSKDKTYADDSTCQFIRFKLYLLQQDYSKAKDALTLLKPLVERGENINGKVDGLSSIDQLNTLLNEIKPRGEGRPSDG